MSSSRHALYSCIGDWSSFALSIGRWAAYPGRAAGTMLLIRTRLASDATLGILHRYGGEPWRNLYTDRSLSGVPVKDELSLGFTNSRNDDG